MHLFTYIALVALGLSELASARYMGVGRRTPKESGICFEPMDCLIVSMPIGIACEWQVDHRIRLATLAPHVLVLLRIDIYWEFSGTSFQRIAT